MPQIARITLTGTDAPKVDEVCQQIKKIAEIREKSEMKPIKLTSATITRVKPVGMGDRVCIDTCSLMKPGEGMLIGSQSNGLFPVSYTHLTLPTKA